MSVVKRRVFPEAFKREAVERVASSCLSAGAVAAELGLHETVLRRWMTQFGTQATGASRRPIPQAASPSPSDLAAENARLRRENDRLRMEREILKKTVTIFGAGAK
jgi:transposase